MNLSPLRIEIQNLDKKHDIPFDCSLCNIKKVFPHKHETELELIYCLKGSVRLIAADQDFTICAGEIHSIDFGDIHYLSSTEDNTTLVFHIDLSFHPEWNIIRHVFFACESLHCYPYQDSAMREVKDIILSLSYKYFSEDTLDKVHYYPLLCHLVDILFKYFNWYNYNNQDEYMNTVLFERFTRILVYISKNYREKISISQLATEEHINKNYFSQFISKTVFSSFSNMVNYTRCYNAEKMLLTTDKSVSDISFDCGFSDPKYFYSAFKTLWHKTPSQHREMYRKYYEACLSESTTGKGSTDYCDEYATRMLGDYIVQWHLEKTLEQGI